eukprot:8396538-Alexandrium_andersonii.AAC.1
MSASLVGSEMCIRDRVGAGASQHTLPEGANSAVTSVITQARVEFQAQGSSVGETRAAMEALFASCSEEFQSLRGSRAQEITV